MQVLAMSQMQNLAKLITNLPAKKTIKQNKRNQQNNELRLQNQSVQTESNLCGNYNLQMKVSLQQTKYNYTARYCNQN